MSGEEWLVLSFPIGVSALPEALTPSERKVVDAVLRGLSNAEIARGRGTSIHTISNQLTSVFQKLGVHSRLELVRSIGRGGDVNSDATAEEGK